VKFQPPKHLHQAKRTTLIVGQEAEDPLGQVADNSSSHPTPGEEEDREGVEAAGHNLNNLNL